MSERADRIFLVGPPGVGKTTVGRALAERLGWPFRDLDEEIAARVEMKVPDFLAERGEEAFRREEADCLLALLSEAPLVLACGGGAPCRHDNLARMQAAGTVVGLEASLDTLVERTSSGDRPLLQPTRRERLAPLLELRAPWYGRADLRVDTDGRDPGDVVDEVLRGLELRRSGA